MTKGKQKPPKGYEIPVPTKEDVFKVLEKAAQPTKPSTLPSPVYPFDSSCSS